MIKVSLIMPVYNSEEYLPQAIDSILNQSMKEWELILVDDGSTDRSSEICDEFAAGDERIKVIHQDNQGITKARNTGLCYAKGQYIGFMDNDDVCEATMLEDNYQLALDQGAEVIKFGCVEKRYGGSDALILENRRTFCEFLVLDRDRMSSYFCPLKESMIINTVWNGLYSRQFLRKHQIQFCEWIKTGIDDQIFNIDVLIYAKKVVINPQCYYYWMRRYTHSTSCKYMEERIRDHYFFLNKVREGMESFNIDYEGSRFWDQLVISNFVDALLLIVDKRNRWSEEEKVGQLEWVESREIYERFMTGSLARRLLCSRDKRGVVVVLYVWGFHRGLLLLGSFYKKYRCDQ